jgi:hypothetical protein
MSGPHYAVSYTPPSYSPLAKFGAGILGYDCFEGTLRNGPCQASIQPFFRC